MKSITDLQTRRKSIAKAINGIHSMRKGTLNATNRKVVHKNGDVVTKGPYYALTSKDSHGKTLTTSVSADELPLLQKEVDNYKEFRRLVGDYIEVCENIALLKGTRDDTKKN
jgi:hypothetical protein